MKRSVAGLYAILPADLETTEMLEKAEQVLLGGVRTVQFRDKKSGYKRALKRALALREVTQRYQAMLVVNDSLQMAQDAGADGVHLGRNDLENLPEIRHQAGANMVVGVTCRADAAFAQMALQQGADYVAFGAVFGSSTKPEVPTLGLPRLMKARQMFPHAQLCAIGGITLENMAAVKATGVNSAALISGLFDADDLQQRARDLITLWEQA